MTEKRKIKFIVPTGTEGFCGRCQQNAPLVENPRGPEPRCMGCLEQDDRERTHGLKTASGPFQDVVAGRKKFEHRIDDRDFQVGDLLQLRELVDESDTVDPTYYDYEKPVRYTGNVHVVRVTHILRGEYAERYGVAKGYCVMSIEDAYMETGRPPQLERASIDVMAALFRDGVPTDQQLSYLVGLPIGILSRHGKTPEEIRGFVHRVVESSIVGAEGGTLAEAMEAATGAKVGDA
jgi:hypothetical protein